MNGEYDAGMLEGPINLDDEPVLGPARICAECRKTNVPLIQHRDSFLCDQCDARSVDFGRKHFAEPCDDSVELTYRYEVSITVKAKSRKLPDVQEASLRATEILLGLPMSNDTETWTQELISVDDPDGNEVEQE